MERDGLTEEEARRRTAVQPTNLEYIQQANVIFSTQWEPDYTQKQVRRLCVSVHETVEPFLQRTSIGIRKAVSGLGYYGHV